MPRAADTAPFDLEDLAWRVSRLPSVWAECVDIRGKAFVHLKLTQRRPALSAMVDAGYLEHLANNFGGDVYTLTVLAASRLDLIAIESVDRHGVVRTYRWAPRSAPVKEVIEPEPGIVRGVKVYPQSMCKQELETMADPKAVDPADDDPGTTLDEVDETVFQARREPDPETRATALYEASLKAWKVVPRHILGLSVHWPATATPDAPCPGCGDRPPDHGYCLVCSRFPPSSPDPVYGDPTPVDHRKPTVPKYKGDLAGGLGEVHCVAPLLREAFAAREEARHAKDRACRAAEAKRKAAERKLLASKGKPKAPARPNSFCLTRLRAEQEARAKG